MGFSSVLLHTHDTTRRMIKSLVLTCLVAAVRADAEADAYYSIYGYAGVPFGSSTGLDPITQGLALPYHGYAGYGYPYYGHYLGKRAADAVPAVVVASAVPFGSSTGLDPITQGLDPVTQGFVPYHGYVGYGYPYYGHYLGKRSADAEADAYYDGYPFAYAAHPYAYAGYHAYPYAAYVPFGSSTGLDPITQGLDPVTQGLVH